MNGYFFVMNGPKFIIFGLDRPVPLYYMEYNQDILCSKEKVCLKQHESEQMTEFSFLGKFFL